MKKDPCKPHACNIQKCLKGTCLNGCKTAFAFQENGMHVQRIVKLLFYGSHVHALFFELT